jgi:hypothetical protein
MNDSGSLAPAGPEKAPTAMGGSIVPDRYRRWGLFKVDMTPVIFDVAVSAVAQAGRSLGRKVGSHHRLFSIHLEKREQFILHPANAECSIRKSTIAIPGDKLRQVFQAGGGYTNEKRVVNDPVPA